MKNSCPWSLSFLRESCLTVPSFSYFDYFHISNILMLLFIDLPIVDIVNFPL